MPPNPRTLLDPKGSTRRVAAGLLALVVAGGLGAQTVRAFDVGRHKAAAATILSPTDPAVADRLVVRKLVKEPGAVLPKGAGGELRFDPTGPLSVITLHGMPRPKGDERYLVFMRDDGGSALAGATLPNADGEAVVRFSGEPRPTAIWEVLVTRAVDDADSSPHGDPLLRWFDNARERGPGIPWVVARR